jgi:polyisoprenoid-binding protein YceI
MQIAHTALAAALALAGSSGAALAQATYDIDPAHSAAQFSVRHLMISNVKGEFTKVTGTVVYDPKNLAAARIDAVIDATTINTREPKRDAHLKSPDFFDTAKYPTLTFKSKQVTRVHGALEVKGDLTIHGVTREVTLAVDGPTPEQKDPWGKTRIGASATTRINRKDFGLAWNKALEAGGVMVGDEVSITIDLEAVKSAPAGGSAN